MNADAATASNSDESKVLPYTLPNPLLLPGGDLIQDSKTWQKKGRPHILKLFQDEVYGRSPARTGSVRFNVTSVDPQALGGKATRKEVTIELTKIKGGPVMRLLLYVPNGAARPSPAFLGLNFDGNQTVAADPGITLAMKWSHPDKQADSVCQQASESTRGKGSEAWQVEKIIARGYALATVYCGDIEPDYADGWQHGLRAALGKKGAKTEFKPNEWGCISAWAWGLSRALDYLEKDKDIDAHRVAVMGHSRLGKTALWAGAQDERFALVISNESGEGGAALARRNFGETTAIINRNFPHWFSGNFKQYADREDKIPVDQHELLALIAPRPLYVASAELDLWSDPRGEFLSAKHAEPVYRLFGKTGLGSAEMPALNQPVGDIIRYHIRTGKHDVTAYDWEQYLDFADKQMKPARNQ
jgi:hypothetical protein